MKILYFSRSYTPHDHRFLSAIAENGHQAFFLPLDPRLDSETRPLPKTVRKVSGTLDRAIIRINPDLIHAGPLTDCAYLASQTQFRPLVVMSWGSDILWEAKRNTRVRERVRISLDHPQTVIVDCDAVKRAVLKFGIRQDQVVVFPWGIDLKKFHPYGSDGQLRRLLGWQDCFVILHLRAWEPLYDPLTVVKAFVRAAHRNARLRLLMPGTGSLNPRILREIKSAGLTDLVHLPGRIGQDKLPNYFRAADVYLSASLSDGSSVSLMEGLACGLPLIVSDIPGNREWVKSGRQGWLFKTKNVTALSELLLKASGCKRLSCMSMQARKTAEQKADWNENKAGLEKAYQLAVRGR